MGKIIDLRRKKFGLLTVLAWHPKQTSGNQTMWLCRCRCGTKCVVLGSSLRTGYTRSCGCLRKYSTYTHGLSGTRTYRVWQNMKQRCFNPRHNAYSNYGGRGITICDRWLDVKNLYADMGERPPGMSLDRIDPNGNYEPGNCRWASPKMQRANQRPRRRSKRHRIGWRDELVTYEAAPS